MNSSDIVRACNTYFGKIPIAHNGNHYHHRFICFYLTALWELLPRFTHLISYSFCDALLFPQISLTAIPACRNALRASHTSVLVLRKRRQLGGFLGNVLLPPATYTSCYPRTNSLECPVTQQEAQNRRRYAILFVMSLKLALVNVGIFTKGQSLNHLRLLNILEF